LPTASTCCSIADRLDLKHWVAALDRERMKYNEPVKIIGNTDLAILLDGGKQLPRATSSALQCKNPSDKDRPYSFVFDELRADLHRKVVRGLRAKSSVPKKRIDHFERYGFSTCAHLGHKASDHKPRQAAHVDVDVDDAIQVICMLSPHGGKSTLQYHGNYVSALQFVRQYASLYEAAELRALESALRADTTLCEQLNRVAFSAYYSKHYLDAHLGAPSGFPAGEVCVRAS
jgi:hypothetical protein